MFHAGMLPTVRGLAGGIGTDGVARAGTVAVTDRKFRADLASHASVAGLNVAVRETHSWVRAGE